MVKFGYKLMTEEHGPCELVRHARAAEQAGFAFLASSDHDHPWLEAQGHAPFAWSVLGAIAAVTDHAELMTAVTCPTIRYHPVIIAQAAATLALLSDGRFSLGVGTGERLNEHVVGLGWPAADERQDMLAEAIAVMRTLWQGGMQSFRGEHYTLEDAQVFDLPEKPPPVIVAVGGTHAARLAAEHGDGLITTESETKWLDVWRSSGGKGPLYAEVSICWAPSRETALDLAYDLARYNAIGGFKVSSGLPNVVNFEAAAKRVEKQELAESLSCGPDVEVHARAIKKYVDAGFDHIIVHQPGPDQDGFLRFWQSELAPALHEMLSEAA